MTGKFKGFLLLGVALAAVTAEGPSRAAPDGASPDAARRAAVALTVGGRTVTVGELEDRLAAIPPAQLATLGGTTTSELVHAYVDQVLVRDLLLTAGAERRGLAKKLPTSYLLERARSTATLRALRKKLPSAAAIPEADVRKYYEENRSRFDSPERVNLWRILVAKRDDAEDILARAQADATVATWAQLARERSIDKATNLRSGNLGFLSPDGTSNEAGLKADPALLEAASGVKDGQLVPRPVQEGANWAVVWRRGTVPANQRSLEQASAQIRSTLFRERTEAMQKDLIASLRKAKVRDVNESLLGIVELRPFDAGLSLRHPAPLAPPGASK